MLQVSHWLAHFCEQSGVLGALRELTYSISRVSLLISNAGDKLSTDERAELHTLVVATCSSWTALSQQAQHQHEFRWQMTVKHHFWYHCLMRAVRDGRNPKHFWCFGDESSVRDLKDIAAKSHPNLMSLRSVESRYAMLGLGMEQRHQYTQLDGLVDY